MNDRSICQITAICWNIWKARNSLVFRGISPVANLTVEGASSDINLWSTANPGPCSSSRPAQTLPPRPQLIPPPNTSSVKVYCDGSFQNDPHQAAYGIIIMNAEGQVCDGRAGRFFCSSPIVSEARALLEAVTFAALSGARCIIFSDCLTLVASIKALKCKWPWECYGLLGRITDILSSSPSTTVRFIPRKENVLADWVAREARQNRLQPDWLQQLLYSQTPAGDVYFSFRDE
ncbi:hypothetical protein LINPERHAP1_LOCUS20329 [Linum perenne]